MAKHKRPEDRGQRLKINKDIKSKRRRGSGRNGASKRTTNQADQDYAKKNGENYNDIPSK